MSKICGNCHYYTNSPMHGPWCSKNKKEVSYLQNAFDCWIEPGTAPAEEMQMKVCSHCGRELPISKFGRHSRTKDGYQPCCKECQSEMNKGRKKRNPFQHNEAPKKAPELTPEQMGIGKGRRADHPTYIDKDTGVTMKWCRGCKQYKPIDEFHHNKANKDGHEFDCKVCHNARVAEGHRRKRDEKKALVAAEVAAKIVHEYVEAQPKIEFSAGGLTPSLPIVLVDATDEQLVEELKRRGYTGNIIRKTSFIF